MPVESAIVIAAILLAFGLFAGTLAWADASTRRRG
jgi:hypothetical protein